MSVVVAGFEFTIGVILAVWVVHTLRAALLWALDKASRGRR